MFRKKTGMIGIAITVLIIILLVFLTNTKTGSLSYIENVISSVIMPIQNRIHLSKK